MPDGPRPRPAGIRIIAILAAIGALFGIIGGWALITGVGVIAGASPLADFDGQTYGANVVTGGRTDVGTIVALAIPAVLLIYLYTTPRQ